MEARSHCQISKNQSKDFRFQPLTFFNVLQEIPKKFLKIKTNAQRVIHHILYLRRKIKAEKIPYYF